jgi:hypothetical protein
VSALFGYAAHVRGKSIGLMAAAVAILASPGVLANGRYPNADMLIVDPSNPDHLVLRATFGTLVSSDQGKSWSWICEQAAGYTGDPALTVLAGGTLLYGFLGNITASTGEGCSFAPVPFTAEGRTIVDVTLDPSDPSRAWVLASGLNGRLQANLLEVSASSANPSLVSDDFVPMTVEVSRSRPERMYVLGFDASFQSTLLVSDDRGQSWSSRRVSPYSALPMYLSAVDPLDPQTVYVRVQDGTTDHLLVTHDAGLSFLDVLSIDGAMLGFALSPDGSRVAAGGPDAGLSVASTADFSFSPAAKIESLRCLTWAERGLYACAQESLDHWTLAISTDAGQSFTPLWHIQDLQPLECAASTSTGAACPRAWLDVSAQIGADLVPDGMPNSGGAGSDSPTPASSTDDSSCGVAAARRERGASLLGISALSLVVAALLRRRRRCGASNLGR